MCDPVFGRTQGISNLIMPAANKRDFEELPADVKAGMSVTFVQHYDEVFVLALGGETTTNASGSAPNSASIATAATPSRAAAA